MGFTDREEDANPDTNRDPKPGGDKDGESDKYKKRNEEEARRYDRGVRGEKESGHI